MSHLREISPQQMFDLIHQAKLPKLQSYETRDKSQLFYRYYSSHSDLVFILLHGISEDSKYLFRLAEYLSANNLAHVYTPDLRGYGDNACPRGDVDYIGQLDDDLADFITLIKDTHPTKKIVMGGHSFGGASVLRFSGKRTSDVIDAFLFIAPFIHPNAPTNKVNDENRNNNVSLIQLIMLTWFEKVILNINKPAEIQHGGEALNLSYRLLMSRIPEKYKENINKITKPSLVIVAGSDELFHADQFEHLYMNNHNIEFKILPNHNHDGILYSQETFLEIEKWLTKL